MKRKGRIFLTVIGLGLLVLGLTLVMEGGLRISTKSFPKIQDKVEHLSQGKLLNTAHEDNVYLLLCAGNEKSEGFVYEVIQNPITKLYSIADQKIADKGDKWIGSVIESSVFAYPYKVDLRTGEISIYEKTLSDNLYVSILIMFWGVIIIIYQKRRRK